MDQRLARQVTWSNAGILLILVIIQTILFKLRVPDSLACSLVGYCGPRQMFEWDARCLPGSTLGCVYDPSSAIQLMADLGPLGRRAIITTHLVFDFTYPVEYSLLFAFVLALAWPKGPGPVAKVRWIALLPLIAGVADWLENLGLGALALGNPSGSLILASITNVMTLLKSWVFVGSLALSLIALALLAGRWVTSLATRHS
jgi:hypothetical protein